MKRGQTECFKSYNCCGIPKALTKFEGTSVVRALVVKPTKLRRNFLSSSKIVIL